MNRGLQVDRLYSLGDYKNIRFTDTINELPQEVLFDEDLVMKIRFLQMLNIELAFHTYKELAKKVIIKESEGEDIMQYLEEVKVNTLNEIKDLMNGNLKGE